MRWLVVCLALLAGVGAPAAAWARGSHGGHGHFGSGHFHPSRGYGHGWHPVHFGGGAFRGYGGVRYWGPYAGWRTYGWGWHRPVYWPAWWMGGYWSPLWPVYETWPFYTVRVVDPAVVVNNAVMMAPVDARYYHHDLEPSAAQDLIDLTQVQPTFSGATGAQYNVHQEGQDPPLLLGNASYPAGFAVTVPSTLRFDLLGGSGTLKVHFGLMLRDEAACAAAAAPDARFSIVGDGRELFASGEVNGSEGSTVSLPLAGVRALELRISAADAAALGCAWGIWAEPEITPHP